MAGIDLPTCANETSDLFAPVAGILAPETTFESATIVNVPGWQGAYLLAIRLEHPIDLSRGQLRGTIAPGHYFYAGSAHGPGGVGARLRRHFRRDKRLHWHVDHLTTPAGDLRAAVFRDIDECMLVARLSESGRFAVPLAGFGSSDCGTCASHLLRVRAGPDG